MFQNDPILWPDAAKDRGQALLQDAEAYRRAKRLEVRQPVPAWQKVVMASAVAPIVLWAAWGLLAR